jgi:L-lactate dehydrogenase complex protein LldF
MESYSKQFNLKSEKIAFDREHRQKILHNIGKYEDAFDKGKKFYENLELAKQRAGYYKYKVLNDLDKYLIDFESRFTSHGGKIIWALDANDALKHILNILKKRKVSTVVKSKSMTTEEIALNEALAKNKIQAVETDLGEFIVQQAGEKPYHIVTPAMHKSKEEIAKLMNEKFDLPLNSTPEEITSFVHHHLREYFIKADAGISGANFLIADPGAIAITENEGNALLSTSIPSLHIVVAGIEKVIPTIEDLDLFWPLLATHGTGQNMTAYNSIIFGPRQDGEQDGPDEVIVILIDNGRTRVLEKEQQRIALSCIRCGACLNACPIYKNIGGYVYETTYTGPIGSVISPLMKNFEQYNHLSFASSLCGKCTEVCPVKIPLHELLLFNRYEAIKSGYTETSWKRKMQMSRWIFLHRKLMDAGSPRLRQFLINKIIAPLWGPRRILPRLSTKSFSKQWTENLK